MIKAIIFDFFDVIRADAFHAWMRNHGFTRDDEAGRASERKDTGQIDQEEFCRQLGLLTGQTSDEVRAEFRQSEDFDEQVIEILHMLQGKTKLGLLSNSDGVSLRNELGKRDLEPLFDEIIISGEVGVAKPDAKIFKLALQRLQVQPEEALFIDDQQKNIDAARKSGIHGLRFQNAKQLRDDLKRLLND